MPKTTATLTAEIIFKALHGASITNGGTVVEAWDCPLRHGAPMVPIFAEGKLLVVEVRETVQESLVEGR